MTTSSGSGSKEFTLESARQQRAAGTLSREDYWQIVSAKLKILSEIQEILMRENLSLQVGQNFFLLDIPIQGTNLSVSMILDINDIRSVPFSVLADGPYENFQAKVLLDLARVSSEFLDIGANMGYYSLTAFKVNPDIKIHAFEPQPNIFSVLSKNVSLNYLNEKVALHNCGLGSKKSVATMFIPLFTGSGGGSLANLHQDEGTPREVEVEVKVLDEYLGSDSNPDLIKIDVEGFEYEVVSGGIELITQSKPTIVIELLRKWMKPFGKHPQDVVNLLVSKGYQVYAISSVSLTQITRIDDETTETNFVFVHSTNTIHLAKISNYI